MNQDIKQTCILIPGMHRSGTSALTGTLSLLDVYLGSDLMEGNFANEKGYFENNTLFEINEKLLAQINSSWDDVFFDDTKPKSLKESDELKNTIINEFEYAKIFAIKDPRLVYLFPVYEKILKKLKIDIKIILPYRNPVEVANSLNRRDNMPVEKGMLLWACNFLLAEKFTRSYERIFINFDKLISNTPEVIGAISKKLSIPLDEKYKQNQGQIDNFLDPGLKHHNITIENLSKHTPKIVLDILSLNNEFNNADNSDLSLKFDELRDQLFSYKKLFYNESIIKSLAEGKTAKEELKQKKHELILKEKELKQTEDKLQLKEQKNTQSEQIIQIKIQEMEKLKNELANIYSSKSWKFTRPLSRLFMKFKNL